jgi:ParB/RepB/Spo0J family partition protein
VRRGEGGHPHPDSEVIDLPVSAVHPSGLNPRKGFEGEGLGELSESIIAHGVLQPIVVREDDRGYSIIIGERRWRAAKQAGLEVVPAVVWMEVSDQQALEMAIIENLQREDLDPIEEGEAYRAMQAIGGVTQKDLAWRVSRSQGAVSKKLRLLGLPSSVREMVAARDLSARHGLALTKYEGYPDAQRSIAETVVECGLGASSVEADLGTCGPAGIIGGRLIQKGLAVQIARGEDPCHRKVCPFQARFGDLCLNPNAHAGRVEAMVAGAERASGGGRAAADFRPSTGKAADERYCTGVSDGESLEIGKRLQRAIAGLESGSHRGMVILALLALRWCRSGGQWVDGEFVVDESVPSFDWDDAESIERLDAAGDLELMRLAVGSACREEMKNVASSKGEAVLTRYLVGE